MTKVLEAVKAGVATGDAVQKIFELAKAGNYALPAVNCVNTDTVNSVLEAAAKANTFQTLLCRWKEKSFKSSISYRI